jgi:hypothetical protein
MRYVTCLQHVEPAATYADALLMASAMLLQDGCLTARVIGDGAVKPHAAQGFFDDVPGVTWFPDGTRRVVAPASLLTR